MFAKFTVSSFKTLPRAYQTKFYSTSKDWVITRANPCDKDRILSFVTKLFLKQNPLAKALIKEPLPDLLTKGFKNGIDQGLTVVAKRSCCDSIIGVSVNRKVSSSAACRIAEISKEVTDCGLKKYLQTLSKIENESNLYNKLNIDKMCLVGTLTICDKFQGKCLEEELVKKSLELAAEEYSHAKFVCFAENHKKIAEKLKMTKAWKSPYIDLICTGNVEPRGIPDTPNENVYVYYTELKNGEKPCKPCS
jgi:hypothetical protein